MNLIALKSPSFRLYFMGSMSAVNGLWILRILIGWLAWELTNSASFVGWIAALSLLPSLFIGPFFGVMVDRASIKLAAFCTNASIILCVCTLLAIQIADILTPTLLSICTLAIGIVTAGHHPVRMSLGPRLVGREHVGSVVALAALNFNTARMISPAIGGIIIDLFGITAALAITILFYLPSLIVVPFLRPRDREKITKKEAFSTAFTNGLKYISQRIELKLVLAMTALMSASIRSTTEILPVVADGIFNSGATGLGQLGSAVGAGALLSAIVKALGPVQTDHTLKGSPLIIAAIGITTVFIFGNSENWPLTLFTAAILGFCSTYLGVAMQSAMQSDLPDGFRGRVMSIWTVTTMGATAIGSLAVGAITELLQLPMATFLLSFVCFIALIALRFQVSQSQKL
ncbi:MFS transporter [Amylibacter sp. SFDW26]|uniref:MFS transporter n=1 Tax=Amylibacter sp. SFDW26 TaxID=2652722 RepID=UPI0012618961|nr:MFS transporter [Amylibacter sp. SFDW26]KAB7616323.1 MFS transporter [Amylibacter sp. SFDW26]